MDLRRLEMLLELSRQGTMQAVADTLGTNTSTVSQQIAALAREVGTPLVEPDGRRVRLSPAGRRLANHAVGIIAAVEAARADLDPGTEPTGVLRVAGFATAIRRALLPVRAELTTTHPGLRMTIREHEPHEAFALLADDDVDLALVYDYGLAPLARDPSLEATPLWSVPWGLGVPAGSRGGATSRETFAQFRDAAWIANSRNVADETAVRTIATLAGFEPALTHHVDSLDLVQDFIAEGLGVGLLPLHEPTREGVTVLRLRGPAVELRAYAVVRGGRAAWPPLALVLDRVISLSRSAPGRRTRA